MWKITKMNENYTFCDSYPAVWAIPAQASDENIQIVCSYRSRGVILLFSSDFC